MSRLVSRGSVGALAVAPGFLLGCGALVGLGDHELFPADAGEAAAGDAASVVCPPDVQRAIDATAVGQTLELTGCTFGSGATVRQPITLSGGTFKPARGASGLTVTAADVTLDRVKVIGAQSSVYDENEAGLLVMATASTPIANLTVRGCELATFGGYGMRLEHVRGAKLEGNTIHDIVFTGVMVRSGSNGTIEGNTIERIGVGWSEARAQAAAGITLANIDGDSFSEQMTVSQNVVRDVPSSRAFYVAGARTITFTKNEVSRSSRGIFIATSGGPSGATNRPTDIHVTGNTFGSPSPVTENLLAVTTYNSLDTTVTGNTVRGWGADGFFSDYQGLSTNLVVSDNDVVP